MAGTKAIGKACSSAVEFISKISPKAQKMVRRVTGFIRGIRDAIGKIIWLVGEKVSKEAASKGSKTIDFEEYQKIDNASRYNVGKDKVMLGKYDSGGPSSYISKAGTDYEYFDL